MKTTEVSIQKLRETFSYDPETGLLTRIKKGRGKYKLGHVTNSLDKDGYLVVYVYNYKLKVHRVAWALYYGEWPKKGLDHINIDRSDNRIVNLREATVMENQYNTKSRDGVSPKGVTLLKNGSYRSQIKLNGKAIYLGAFRTKDEAAHAYNKMAIKHHGEFAVLNPIG